jgi:hypothetical protein
LPEEQPVAQGPIIIFDKSALQSFSVDESMWLDNFYVTNITPLFFVETLADLEKKVRSGRTPEQVVGSIAYRTPELQASANVHHLSILAAELSGNLRIDMEHPKRVIGGGQPVVLGGAKGMIFREPPEQEAIRRWQRGEFLEIERGIASGWRRALSLVNQSTLYGCFKDLYNTLPKPKTLTELKALADTILAGSEQERTLRFGMELLGVPVEDQAVIRERWETAGKPVIHTFLPYFSHMLLVDVFFYLGIAADLISRERATHKVDIAYLYYLPFCMVFTSNDKLHINLAPLFMRPSQTFVKGTDLKADLARLDAHYSALPEEVRNRGMMTFARQPPEDDAFLTTRLWDKHLPNWRTKAAEPEELSKEAEAALLDLVHRFNERSTQLDPSTQIPMDEVAALSIESKVSLRRGKWRRFSPEVEAAAKEKARHRGER